MPHRTVFAHTKGGTGKTTVCVNVAGFLQRAGERVLVVDGDPEGHATRNLGLEPEKLAEGLDDLVLSAVGERDVAANLCVYPTAHGVDVMPGTERLHDAYDAARDARGNALADALARVEERYDHVLIDAPSTARTVVADGLRAADDFVLVLDSSMFAQHGAQALKRFLRRLPDRHEIALNPTRAVYVENARAGPLARLKRAVFGTDEARAERVARTLFGTRFVKVPYIAEVVESQAAGTPLSHMEDVPAGAEAFAALADDIREYSWR